MSPRDSIFSLLSASGVPFERYDHDAVHSCESARDIRTAMDIVALGSKSLLFTGKEKFFLVATHADARIRAKGLRSVTGLKDTRFATDEEIDRVLDARAGSIPPFGFADADLPIFVDETILLAERYAFTPGVPTETVVLSGADLRKIFALLPNPVYVFSGEEEYEIIPLDPVS